MKDQSSQTAKKLFKAEFSNGAVDYLNQDQLTRINEISKGESIKGNIESIKQVKPLSEQKCNISDLYFELQQSTEILISLVGEAYRLERDKLPRYRDVMEHISYFIHRNIIDVSKKIVGELDSVLENEGFENLN